MIKLHNKKLTIIAFIISASIILIDQLSKQAVISYFNDYYKSNHIEITSFLNLVLTWNKGISFGMFNDISNINIVFFLSSLLITSILVIWLIKSDNKIVKISLAIVIGGALGNIIDRIRYSAVADFIELHYKEFYWPAFNIADSFISIGIFILVLQSFLEDIKKKNVK